MYEDNYSRIIIITVRNEFRRKIRENQGKQKSSMKLGKFNYNISNK